MATKSKNKKNASAPNPSIIPKVPSDKKPKPSKPTEEQPEAAAADKKLKKQKAKDEIGEMFSAAKASKKRKVEEAGQGGKRKKPKERAKLMGRPNLTDPNHPGLRSSPCSSFAFANPSRRPRLLLALLSHLLRRRRISHAVSPMATKSKNTKKASAPNPSITPKSPSDKKPKPSKPTEEQPEEAAAADKKQKKQKAKDEIGEIFSAAKASKKRKGEEAGQGSKRKKPKEKAEDGNSKKKNKNTPGSKGKGRGAVFDDHKVEEKRPRRCTEDGLAIYSAEELGFGKASAGGTALCPFDCDCCF